MRQISKVEKGFIRYLEDDLDLIQDFVKKKVTSKGLTAKKIYAELKGQLSKEITDVIFASSLSVHVRLGNIKGIVGKKGKGYVPCDDSAPAVIFDDSPDDSVEPTERKRVYRSSVADDAAAEVDEPDEDDKVGTQIALSPRYQLSHLDRYNWVLREKKNDAWANRAYYPNLSVALKSTARRLLDKELRSKSGILKYHKDVEKLIREAETRIMEQLNSIVTAAMADNKAA